MIVRQLVRTVIVTAPEPEDLNNRIADLMEIINGNLGYQLHYSVSISGDDTYFTCLIEFYEII